MTRRKRLIGALAAVAIAATAGGIAVATTIPSLTRGGTQSATNSWYANNFQIGGWPKAMTFDGTNLWIAIDNTDLHRFNTIKGALDLKTNLPDFVAETNGMTTDGTSVWVTGGDKLSKLSGTTGAVTFTTTYPAGAGPRAVLYDGAFVWTANFGDSTITRVSTAIPTRDRTYSVGAGNKPVAIAFDGLNIWTANTSTNTLSKVNATTGALTQITLPAGSGPVSLAFDAVNMWVGNTAGNVMKINATTGAIMATVPLPPRSVPRSIVLDVPGFSLFPNQPLVSATYVWVASAGSHTVTKINVANAGVAGIYPTGPNPAAVSFDGTYVWVLNGSNPSTLTRFQAR